jgi:hypothetical protein
VQAWHLQWRKAIIGKPVGAMLLLIQAEADGTCACVVCILQVFPDGANVISDVHVQCYPSTRSDEPGCALQMRQGHAWLVIMMETADDTWMSSLNIEVPSG